MTHKCGVRITTLCDNMTARRGLLAEHGLSLLLEVDGQSILLDTGQTFTMLHNAQVLGVDLRCLDAVVLSHGHFDHTGGLRGLLSRTDEVVVYAHPDLWSNKYVVPGDEPARYVGIPFLWDELDGNGARFRFSAGPVQLGDRVLVTGQIARVTPYEQVERRLYIKEKEDWYPDPVWDDQAVVIKTERGLIVALGCAHSGLINTLTYAQQIAGEQRIYAVVGGTHLGPAPREQLQATVEALQSFDIQKLGVSHCTGPKPAALLASVFGERFFYNGAGTVIEL